MSDTSPFDDIEGPREVFVEIHVDYEDDHPQQLRDLLAGVGAAVDHDTPLSRNNRSIVRRVRITAPDLDTWRRARALLGSVPGLTVTSEEDSVALRHRGGKIEVVSRAPLLDRKDLEAAYLPGVARVSLAIARKPELAWQWTTLGRTIAVVGNGTRVLELGALGPLAHLPSIEATAAMYHRFGGVSGVPLIVSEIDVQRIVDAITAVSAGFGAIHLDAFPSPDCFAIEEALCRRTDKLVYHDARHGTAIATIATLLRLSHHLKLELATCDVGVLGIGAVGTAIVRLLRAVGVKTLYVHDPKPEAIERVRGAGVVSLPADDVLRRSQIVVGASGCAGAIEPAWVRRGQIIVSLSKPNPEISVQAAIAAGAAFATDARVANTLPVFPGLMRAVLERRSRSLDVGVMVAAASALASFAPDADLVDPLDPQLHFAVFNACLLAAAGPS